MYHIINFTVLQYTNLKCVLGTWMPLILLLSVYKRTEWDGRSARGNLYPPPPLSSGDIKKDITQKLSRLKANDMKYRPIDIHVHFHI
jgi:hypothetical protein